MQEMLGLLRYKNPTGKMGTIKAVDRLAPDPRPAVDAVVGVFLEDV